MRGSGVVVCCAVLLWGVGACQDGGGGKDAALDPDLVPQHDQQVAGDATADAVRDAASDAVADLSGDQGEPTAQTVTEVVGVAGGTLSHPAGASVTIPAGALAAAEEISVTAYPDARRLPRKMRSSALGPGAVTLQPDGTVFSKPVTITVPTSVPLPPGSRFHLFVWNETDLRWDQTEFMATVDAAGNSYTAEVTHFTTYTGGTFYGPDGLLEYLAVSWDDDDDQSHRVRRDNWADEFMKQRDRTPGRTWGLDDCCWELIGVQFVYDFKSGAYTYNKPKVVGQIVDFDWKEVTTASTPGAPAGAHFRANIYMYWRSSDPEIEFRDPSRTTMLLTCYETEKTSDLTLTAQCGEESLVGVDVEFSLDGKGSIDPEQTETNASGEAKTRYEADDERTKATVSADYTACQQEPQQKTGTVSAQPICVKDCDGWHAFGDITFAHAGEDIVWGFGDALVVSVDFEVNKQTGAVTGGEGEGSHHGTAAASTREHCSVQGMQSPDFTPQIGQGSLVGEKLSFKLAAQNTGVHFVYHCEWPNVEPVDTQVPIYGLLEAAMMGKFLDLEFPLNCGEFVSGTETDTDTDGTTPMTMAYTITIDCKQTCEE